MVMTGKDIFENFNQLARGTGSWQEAQRAATQMAQELPGQAVRIKRLQEEMAVAWTGNAADAAQGGVTPLALEHLNIADDLHTTQDLMSRQAASFHQAANAVQPMPLEPTLQDPLAAVVAGQSLDPMLAQATQYNAVAQHNVDVMTTYDGASRYNATTMPAAFGTLADNPMTITLQPTPSKNAASGSVPSHTTGRPPTPNRTTPAVGRPTAPSQSGSPAPAVAPGASTTTSGTNPGDSSVGTGQTADSTDPGSVAEPTTNGGGGNPIGFPGDPGAGQAIDAGPVERGGGGLRLLGADPPGGAPIDGSPTPRGVGPGLSNGAATEQEAMTAGPGEQAAEVPGGIAPGVGRPGDEDDEHHNKYPMEVDADEVFAGGLPKLAPEALGESPQQRAARHAREAEGGH